LREGWDNPNVFQICKLRSSGSETSKLQEVGRGLRLPVNEYGNRVKDETFHLNYFVDFSESDFVKKLADEINQKSGAMSIETGYKSLNDATLITKILQKYPERFADENALLADLDGKGWIKRNNDFKEGGLEFVRKEFPLIFEGVNSNKVRNNTDSPKRLTVRTEKYSELKALWEQLNQKVILAYQFENEAHFKTLLVSFLRDNAANLSPEIVSQTRTQLAIENHQAQVKTSHSMTYGHDLCVSTMKYSDFLQDLASKLIVNRTTLHHAILEAELPINDYLNPRTISLLQKNFQNYLMANAMSKFEIDYQTVNSQIHPTKLTDKNGNALETISVSDVGVLSGNEAVATNYFFEALYYDSDLEKRNITTDLEEVIVFTKIPKNSIKIPVAGGASYSPDFAYVLKFKNGEQKLNFIVESKGVDNENELRQEELYKIEHAKRLFKDQVQIKFETQFKGDRMIDLIKRVFQG
jgi:type III restriction enzyme